MDSINSNFLDPLPLNNSTISTIKNTIATFIGRAPTAPADAATATAPATAPVAPAAPADAKNDNPLYEALASKCKCAVKDDFVQINTAVFKAAEPFIFYKLGYDYKKFQKVKASFYKYLYVADKLIRMCSDATPAAAPATVAAAADPATPATNAAAPVAPAVADVKNYKNDAYYMKCLRKLFNDSNNFSRQMSNPITAKGDEKMNGFFDSLQKAVIDYPRLIRQAHKDDLKPLDKKAKELKLNIDASEKQKLKLEKTVNELLDQYSSDRASLEYILKLLMKGTGIIKQPQTKQEGVGGKAKRRRRKGGGPDEVFEDQTCIIGYFENNKFFNIKKTDIKRNDRTGVYTVTITELNDNAELSKPVIPEVSELIDKYEITKSNLEKILYADELIKEFELATKGISFANEKINESKSKAIACVSKAKETIYELDSVPLNMNIGNLVRPVAATAAPVAATAAPVDAASAPAAARNAATPVVPTRVARAARAASAAAASAARDAAAPVKTAAHNARDAVKKAVTPTVIAAKDFMNRRFNSAFDNTQLFRGGKAYIYKTIEEKENIANLTTITDISFFIQELNKLLNDSNNKIEIIKSRYNNHPMIIIDKKLESLV